MVRPLLLLLLAYTHFHPGLHTSATLNMSADFGAAAVAALVLKRTCTHCKKNIMDDKATRSQEGCMYKEVFSRIFHVCNSRAKNRHQGLQSLDAAVVNSVEIILLNVFLWFGVQYSTLQYETPILLAAIVQKL
jgi:hypothetical protein